MEALVSWQQAGKVKSGRQIILVMHAFAPWHSLAATRPALKPDGRRFNPRRNQPYEETMAGMHHLRGKNKFGCP